MQIDKLVIEERFQGPPDSGNGGYVCGRLANYVDGAAQVTLRKPPLLNKPMSVHKNDEKIQLFDGDILIAEAVPKECILEIPTPPTWEEAVELSKSYVGFSFHAFPNCFVCGTSRHHGDGLCIYPGEENRSGLVAAPWVPDPSLIGKENCVSATFMWAAMDCPGAFAVGLGEDRLVVLGQLSGQILKTVEVGEQCVVIGWPLGEDGRKFHAGTAIFDASGELCGYAKAIWFAISSSEFGAKKKE